jgi:hypothetical protein
VSSWAHILSTQDIVPARRDNDGQADPVNSDNLKGVLLQFVSRPLPNCRARELRLPIGTGKVVGLAGVRRSGKTFLFFHAIQRLLAEEIGLSQFLCLDPCGGL